ncbi:MAG: YdhR family protein, partial [Clostridiales bacterium]|nr:YdhR family protein [Clostridiales bacterium]
FFRTIFLYLTGRVRFVKSSIGEEFTMDDGKTFTVFRHVVISHYSKISTKPQAVFRVRFQLKGMSIEKNKKFSRIPMLVFMGFHGFRSKYWMADETTGLCQGVYEWDTRQDAENYSRSIALAFMTKRSVPGSVSFEIIENQD